MTHNSDTLLDKIAASIFQGIEIKIAIEASDLMISIKESLLQSILDVLGNYDRIHTPE